MKISDQHTYPYLKHLAALVMLTGLAITSAAATTELPIAAQQTPPNPPRIQLAILLDTSSSMDGLIDQARNQLWQAVNEFSKARRGGVRPILEVAVFEYGNDDLSMQQGHTRQVIGLTRELDQVSEALFSLTTNGGSEYCGYAIDRAVGTLEWSSADQDLKAIFIAGNEPFTQGPLPFRAALDSARNRGISVHTIHAGSYQDGVQSGWQEGARLAGGSYMNIDHNRQVSHIRAPQDRKIAELNARLNRTYIPYGAKGKQGSLRQQAQDTRSNAVSPGLLAERVQSKATSLYDNANWDLVDALDSGSVEIDQLEQEQLPAEMRTMNRRKQQAYVAGKAQERERIQKEITALSEARDTFVADRKRQAADTGGRTLDEAFVSAIRNQGIKKRFVFTDNVSQQAD